MADQFVFAGSVSDGAKPTIDDLGRWRAALRSLAGQRIELVIRKPKSKRSIQQNDYAHKWPFRMIAEEMGESVEAAKLCILGEFFGWVEVRGHLIPAKPSTSALTVAEFDKLIEWMPVFGAQQFGISIPLPGECM